MLRNNVELARAIRHADEVELRESFREESETAAVLEPDPSLRVSIRHDANTVIVHWFAAGDPSQAADELGRLQRKGGCCMKMPTQRVRKHIDRATKLLAAGKTIIEVAHEMGFTSTNVQYWRREYPEFWEQQLNAAGGIPPQPGEVKRPMRPPITAKVRTRIIEATRLFARGLSLTEVAATLKVRPTRLTEYRTVHRDVWQMAQEEADAFVVDLVRSMAGTDAMLDDPGPLSCHGQPRGIVVQRSR